MTQKVVQIIRRFTATRGPRDTWADVDLARQIAANPNAAPDMTPRSKLPRSTCAPSAARAP